MSTRANLRGKHLHLDCFAGVAGDMFLGAALDIGVPEEYIREGLAQLPVDGYSLQVGRAKQMGIDGCDVKVVVDRSRSGGDHHHDHHDHDHRSWRSIKRLIERSGLSPAVRARALDMFIRVARAEARLHDMEEDAVTFHEVGAVDSIVDIVGAALALEYLAPARISSRPVPLGHGTTRCAHGVLPVPSPAALEILAGAEVEDGGADMELCTPTGAAILASCVDAFGQLPGGVVVATGYGAGDSRLPDRANHLRMILFEPAPRTPDRRAVVIEANVDNMPPEWCGHLQEVLFRVGALDVWFCPIMMKKGRPALTVSALCAEADREAAEHVLLTESSTIGLRYHHVARRVLARENVGVATPYGELEVKVARDGDRVLNAAPEYEICKAAADRCAVPLKEVYAAAMAAYRALASAP